jgi:O-antigen/teichoic acid export membrane protein
LLGIAVGLALVRLLAEPVFGAYSLATTSIGLAGILADFGLDTLLIRECALRPGQAARLLRSAVVIRLLVSIAITGLLVTLAAVTDLIGQPDLLLIGGLSLLPRGLLRAYAAALTGTGRVQTAAQLEGITTVGVVTCTLALVVAGLPPDGAAAALAGLLAGNMIGWLAAVAMWQQARIVPDTVAENRHDISGLVAAALPFVLVGLAGAAFQSLDIYVVRLFYWSSGQPDAVALYAAPFRVLNLLLLVPTAWGVVALPRYARLHGDTNARRALIRRDTALLFGVGAVLSIACTALADPLTRLALGERYAGTAPILALLGWMTLPVCLSAPLIADITARNVQRRITISVVLAGVLALGANVIWGAAVVHPGAIDSLLGVAAIKVTGMWVLLGLYWLSARTAVSSGP